MVNSVSTAFSYVTTYWDPIKPTLKNLYMLFIFLSVMSFTSFLLIPFVQEFMQGENIFKFRIIWRISNLNLLKDYLSFLPPALRGCGPSAHLHGQPPLGQHPSTPFLAAPPVQVQSAQPQMPSWFFPTSHVLIRKSLTLLWNLCGLLRLQVSFMLL